MYDFLKVDGIFEEVISKRIEDELINVDSQSKHIETIDLEESPSILSEYVAKIIKKRLQMSLEKKHDIKEQIKIVNKIIEAVEDGAQDFQDNQVDAKGQQLKALLLDDPLKVVVGRKAVDMIRPETSIADTSLFTGAGREPNMCSELNKEIASCDRIDMMVSFIRWSGVVLILDELRRFTERGNHLRVITTSYMGATELRAVEELAKLPNTEIKVSFDGERTRLHAKVYIFHRISGYSTAYVGSSNLTAPAMTSGCEWNVKVTKYDLEEVFNKVEASYNGYWNSKDFELYTSEKKDLLKEALLRCKKGEKGLEVKRHFYFDLYPYPYQQAILDKLEVERNIHKSYRNLVCAATGTGKTIISAFDYRNQCIKNKRRLKLLFVAHRKEILEQSIECYREILKDFDFADLFYNGRHPEQIDFLFASIDILNSRRFIELPKDYYDYIVLDECHHLAAKTYKAIFDHFQPEYFLGLTATPERMDGQSILPYYNNRLAAEIRLPEAINRKLLCPFQYFGVADTVDLSTLKWTRGGYDKQELDRVFVVNRAIADKRTAMIVRSIHKYIGDIESIKGLVFCVSMEHAEYMSDQFNKAGIASISLTNKSSKEERRCAKMKLQEGKVKFICVVDLYNEGVDIKEINTVLFLRPTESLTVFLQQLGRGLRLSEGKDCLTVLDFIGQANKLYRFDFKYRALLQKTNQGMKRELESEFPHLPKGCYIKLEKKAKEYILSNIRSSLNGKAGIISKILSFKGDTGKDFSLVSFLDYYSMTPGMIYTHHVTATGVLGKSGPKADPAMWKKMFRLTSVDSADVLKYIADNICNMDSLDLNKISVREMYCLKLLYATFIDHDTVNRDEEIIQSLKSYWVDNSCYIPEVLDLVTYNYEHIDFIGKESGLPYENILTVYATYTRAQALALLDCWRVSSEGVTRVEDKRTTCLFVTLNKGNNYYSPTTAYHDYSINENMFHWQSQNSTSANTIVGQRYIHHEAQKENIILFVREQKDDALGSVPFMFLGKVKYVSHQGNKPMSIIWKMDNVIPAKFIEITDKLGIG